METSSNMQFWEGVKTLKSTDFTQEAIKDWVDQTKLENFIKKSAQEVIEWIYETKH